MHCHINIFYNVNRSLIITSLQMFDSYHNNLKVAYDDLLLVNSISKLNSNKNSRTKKKKTAKDQNEKAQAFTIKRERQK